MNLGAGLKIFCAVQTGVVHMQGLSWESKLVGISAYSAINWIGLGKISTKTPPSLRLKINHTLILIASPGQGHGGN
jgi:hypothetical protein